jgi:TolB-like protein
MQPSLPTSHEIETQGARILSYRAMLRSPMVAGLFRYLLAETLEGRAGELNQSRIALEYFKLKPDYDAANNPVVRVAASRLRLVLGKFYADHGLSDLVRIELPRGGYALQFRSVAGTSAGERPVLGLLEFEGLGLMGGWEWFPKLLAEEFSVAMSGIRSLRLLGPFPRRGRAGESMDAHQLRASRPVDFLLDGSIEKQARKLVIRYRLLDGADGTHLWARKHVLLADSPDFREFEERLVREVALELGSEFGVLETRLASLARVKPNHLWSVFEAVLCGRMYFTDFSRELCESSLASLRAAVTEFPDEVLPHATLATVLGTACFESFWSGPVPYEEIDFHANRALEIDPGDPWAVIAGATAAVIHRRDEELAAIGRAVREMGQPPAILTGAVGIWMCYRNVDRPLALVMLRTAMEECPHSPRLYHIGHCLDALLSGELERAESEIDLYDGANDRCDPLVRGAIASLRQDHPEAMRQWERLLVDCPDFAGRGYELLGRLFHEDYCRLICGALNAAGATIRIRA